MMGWVLNRPEEIIMEYRYTCPHCSGLLNPGGNVIFVVESQFDRDLFLLSPEPGDYHLVHKSSFPLEKGEHYTFRCPLCREDLRSHLNEDLVEIHLEDSESERFTVNFSRVYGERATFFRAKGRTEKYGEHAASYESLNFFGAGHD